MNSGAGGAASLPAERRAGRLAMGGYWPAGWQAGWLAGGPAGRPAWLPAGLRACWPAVWLANWLEACPVIQHIINSSQRVLYVEKLANKFQNNCGCM